MGVLYKAHAQASGGRTGTAHSDDGRLDVTLSTPKELGGDGGKGTNPEQLFAAGYSACFLGAMKFVAGQEKVKLPDDLSVAADVGIGPREDGGGFGIEVALTITAPGMDKARGTGDRRQGTCGVPLFARHAGQHSGDAHRRLIARRIARSLLLVVAARLGRAAALGAKLGVFAFDLLQHRTDPRQRPRGCNEGICPRLEQAARDVGKFLQHALEQGAADTDDLGRPVRHRPRRTPRFHEKRRFADQASGAEGVEHIVGAALAFQRDGPRGDDQTAICALASDKQHLAVAVAHVFRGKGEQAQLLVRKFGEQRHLAQEVHIPGETHAKRITLKAAACTRAECRSPAARAGSSQSKPRGPS
jgi:osmotically inducible protein OsmC